MTEPAHQIEPLITADRAADILGVHVNWIYKRVSDGTLRSYRVGHHRKFRPSELEAFIQTLADEKMATVTPISRRR